MVVGGGGWRLGNPRPRRGAARLGVQRHVRLLVRRLKHGARRPGLVAHLVRPAVAPLHQPPGRRPQSSPAQSRRRRAATAAALLRGVAVTEPALRRHRKLRELGQAEAPLQHGRAAATNHQVEMGRVGLLRHRCLPQQQGRLAAAMPCSRCRRRARWRASPPP